MLLFIRPLPHPIVLRRCFGTISPPPNLITLIGTLGIWVSPTACVPRRKVRWSAPIATPKLSLCRSRVFASLWWSAVYRRHDTWRRREGHRDGASRVAWDMWLEDRRRTPWRILEQGAFEVYLRCFAYGWTTWQFLPSCVDCDICSASRSSASDPRETCAEGSTMDAGRSGLLKSMPASRLIPSRSSCRSATLSVAQNAVQCKSGRGLV